MVEGGFAEDFWIKVRCGKNSLICQAIEGRWREGKWIKTEAVRELEREKHVGWCLKLMSGLLVRC